jgi:predicted RNase H-like nuclease (RuvC/YqgF family)
MDDDALLLAQHIEDGYYGHYPQAAAKMRRQHAEITALRAEVERLRAELSATTERLENRAGTVRALCAETVRLQAERDEARAEAERLREALQRIADFTLLEFEGPHHMALVCVETARAALDKKETT